MTSGPLRLSRTCPGLPGKGEHVRVRPDWTPSTDGLEPPRLEDFAFLSPRETEYYLFVVESSLRVRRSHHFFLWAQGQLQSLLPHDVLICVHGILPRFEFAATRYTRSPIVEQEFAEMCNARTGLVSRVIAEWHRNWQEPWLAHAEDGHAATDPDIEALIDRYRLSNIACHGMQAISGSANSCFIFAGMPQPPGRRQRYLLELLLPHLYAAFVRTLAGGQHVPRGPLQCVLTGREVEILRWVSDGKSNLQIGRSLRISPLTVKNHVQNILRKLDVQNRAQAVSKAINLRLIDSERRD